MLKSLELFGFKSFADRTRFDFHTGVTGVVGPNGSGKSNVVDSIKWILGDQSAKSLRGKEMIDVIFNGATGRKGSPFAEATLTFDNATRFLPIDAAEVHIGRRIHRNGESEYLINRATARLKDVRDLFLGTGAGSASYCIIEQGRVDQILQANVATRRMVFEEAAGISRFQARKADAERKLERVDQNLVRLTDIVDAVGAQLNTMRTQAVRASKYRQVSEELRTLWLGLSADEFRHDSARLVDIQTGLETEQAALSGLNERLAAFEAELSGLDAAIGEVDQELRKVDGEIASHRAEAAGYQSTARHQSARLNEMAAELVRLRRQRVLLAGRARDSHAAAAAAVDQLAQSEVNLRSGEQELADWDQQHEPIAARAAAARAQIQALREELPRRTAELADSTHELARLQGQLEHRGAALQANAQRAAAIEERLQSHRDELAVREAHLAEAIEAAGVALESAQRVERQRIEISGVQERFHETIAARRDQRSDWRARKNVLEDLELRQEGLGIGVKEILARAANATTAPWNHVVGSAADLLEVDLDRAGVFEVALGRRAQTVVMDQLEPLVRHLEQAATPIDGRVGFLACPREGAESIAHVGLRSKPFSMRELVGLDPAQFPDLSEQPGVECRADRLATSPPQFPTLAERMLCDTWVVDTLARAVELAAGKGRGCRFVTLQGELVEKDGTITVGAIRGETSLVSRKSELRRLKTELVQIDRHIQEDERRLQEVLLGLKDADGALAAASANVQQANDLVAARRLDVTEERRSVSRLETELAAVREEADELDRQRVTEHAAFASTQQAMASLETELQEIHGRIEETGADLAETEALVSGADRRRNLLQIEVAKHAERAKAIRDGFRRLETEQRDCASQSDEAERRLQAVSADHSRVTLHVLNTNADLAECLLLVERSTVVAARLMAEKDELRGRRGVLMRGESAVREHRRQVSQRVHELEIEARELRHKLDGLAARIDEEYQVSLVEIAQSGMSAIESLKAEQSAAEPASTEDLEAAAPSVEPSFEELREQLDARVQKLRRQLKSMGSVNAESLRDLDELERRFSHLSEQLADLVEAKKTLEDIVRRINIESKRMFMEAFEAIRGYFRDLFRKLFGGGEGDVILEDREDVLNCGIDIVARPPGKELRSISLLSGGEKTLTAVALLLAIFKSRPSPFCILDEVDAALDEANVERFAAVLREFRETTQFIMITHSKRSMAAADLLYGVTMEESGISKRLSVRFEDVGENGEIAGVKSPAPSNRARRDAA